MHLRFLIFSQALTFPILAQAWDEQRVLDMLLVSSPVLRAYKVVTQEYTPSTPMQRVFESTSFFARASPSEIGTTQATSDGNFLSSSGSLIGLQLSIPLASRKEEREHAVRALNEVRAVEELRGAVLQDLGVLRQHEADYQATEQRITLWSDKSGWAQERVKTGYDDAAGLWDVAQRLTEEKASRSKLRLAITSQRHRVAAYAGESWKELLNYLRAGEGPTKGKKVTQSSSPHRKAVTRPHTLATLPYPLPAKDEGTVKRITGLIGRDELVIDVVREIRKGKHVLLTGPTGIGKSRVLEAAVTRIERRRDELQQMEMDPTNPDISPPAIQGERRQDRRLTLAYLRDHQAKGQFVALSKRLLEARIVKPSALGLPKRMDTAPIDWHECKRTVNRQGIRDITGAILPAIHAYKEHGGRLVIAVDDLTFLTPTQSAFWLAVFDQAQLVGCASAKKDGNRKLWWRMKEVEIPALTPEASTEIVRIYIARKGILIESPDLYISHVVKQAQGNPQAIADMLDDSAKERLVNKRQIREMKHAAGVRYLDFTPVMIVSGACIIGARYVAIGLGDTALYVMAGMAAALFLSLRFFLFKGAGRAN